MEIDYASETQATGKAARGLIRPYDLEIETMTPRQRSLSARLLLFTASMLAVLAVNARGQTPQPSSMGLRPVAGSEPANAVAAQPATQPADTKETLAKKPAPYASRAFGVGLGPEPPDYVKPLSLYGWPGCEKIDWLDFGLEHRTRFEHRDDDYRRPRFQQDDQFLLRSRTYLGINKVFDPLRFGVEFQDSRQFNSDFPETNRDVDEADFLQAFAELYFKDALGKDQPLSLRAGRMTLEYTDTHMVARSRWANAPTSFDGFRLRLGEPTSDWQFDVFAAMPVERRLTRPDRSDEERWLYGIVGSWRKWHQYVTLEPYYFILDEDRKDPTAADREIHTLGLRAFGPIADTNFDYDVDAAFQTGEDGRRDQRAFAAIGELGYSFQHSWKPRLSFSTMYASGDRDPTDRFSERFARLFDSTHGYSSWDLFTWQNVISPKVRLELKPTEKLRFGTSYGAYWLASDSDAWVVPNRRDPAGTSGDGIGQEVDLRLRYLLDPRVEIEIGYSRFFAGPFIENTGPADDADFFYIQTTLRL